MAVWLLGESLALVLLGVPAPVPRVAADPPLALDAAGFDLAARSGEALPIVIADLDKRPQPLSPVPSDDGWTPPLRTWGVASSGPVIELGALGASKIRKRRADLVHLSLDWGF